MAQRPHSAERDPRRIMEEQRPIPAAERRIDWRREYFGADLLILLLGLWLIASPAFLDYAPGDESWSLVVSGALVALAGAAGLIGFSRGAAAAVVMAVAVWLFVSGFVVAESSEAEWNGRLVGLVLFLLAIAAAAASTERTGR